jgi:hypothetical protein
VASIGLPYPVPVSYYVPVFLFTSVLKIEAVGSSEIFITIKLHVTFQNTTVRIFCPYISVIHCHIYEHGKQVQLQVSKSKGDADTGKENLPQTQHSHVKLRR